MFDGGEPVCGDDQQGVTTADRGGRSEIHDGTNGEVGVTGNVSSGGSVGRPTGADWTLMGHFLPKYGYGNAAIEIGRALGQMGALATGREDPAPAVELLDMVEQAEWDAEMGQRFPRLYGQDWYWDVEGRVVCLAIPPWYPFVECEELVGFTMCESTAVPEEFVNPIRDRAARVIVPCEHCKEVYEALGARVDVVPLGIDPEMYPVVERGPGRRNGLGGDVSELLGWQDAGGPRPYTFLWSGTPDQRKGWELVYQAFWDVFRGSPEVRLVMHFRKFFEGNRGFRDSNVVLVQGLIPQGQWLGLLREADCFVYPSRGGGWGLPPREAACTGLPVIATDWGGLAEGNGQWALPLGVERLVSATFGPWEPGDIGLWAAPSVGELKAQMVRCYTNRETAAAFGAQAAEWLRENQTWEHSARALLEVMRG